MSDSMLVNYYLAAQSWTSVLAEMDLAPWVMVLFGGALFLRSHAPHADPRALFVRVFRACWRYLPLHVKNGNQ